MSDWTRIVPAERYGASRAMLRADRVCGPCTACSTMRSETSPPRQTMRTLMRSAATRRSTTLSQAAQHRLLAPPVMLGCRQRTGNCGPSARLHEGDDKAEQEGALELGRIVAAGI